MLVACTGGPTVHVDRIGSGEGRVRSMPAGLDCGSTCSMLIETRPTFLIAEATNGSQFVGWMGSGCDGVGDCAISITDDVFVQARFEARSYQVSVTRSGVGRVTSMPFGLIDCGETCTTTVNGGTALQLFATPEPMHRFVAWDGGCSGDLQTCTVTVERDMVIAAQFAAIVPPPHYTLTVGHTGGGTGSVSGSGIACGVDCAETFVDGTQVMLTATPMPGSQFVEWSGGCVGSAPTCVVTMSGDRAVTARFEPIPPPPPSGCSVLVTQSESAAMFNTRLTTAGARVCIADGVTITGRVVVGANDLQIKAMPGATARLINTNGDAVDVTNRILVALIGLDIRSEGPTLSAAVNAPNSSVDVTDSKVHCEALNCYVVKAVTRTVIIGGSTLTGGSATGYSYGIYGADGAVIHFINSSVSSRGNAMTLFNGSSGLISNSTLRSTHPFAGGDESAIKLVHFSDLMLGSSSTVVTTGFHAISVGMPTAPSTLWINGATVRKASGTPAGTVSPILSRHADNMLRSSSPSTFCNEGTATTDGAFGLPLVSGSYSPMSTFNSVAHVGPIDCP